METQALTAQFQKMASVASEKQKTKVHALQKFVLETARKLEAVMKKTDDSNLDYCFVVVALVIKSFALSAINQFTWVESDPKSAKKFVTQMSKTSLFKMKKPLTAITKNRVTLKKMTEEEAEVYAEALKKPLEEYLREQARRLDALKTKK